MSRMNCRGTWTEPRGAPRDRGVLDVGFVKSCSEVKNVDEIKVLQEVVGDFAL